MKAYQVHDEVGLLRVFNWKDEAERFMEGKEDMKLVVVKTQKQEAESPFALAMRVCGEALF
jgi:hypothetical protein